MRKNHGTSEQHAYARHSMLNPRLSFSYVEDARLSPVTETLLNELPPARRALLLDVITKRNGYVVESSPVVSGCFAANTCMLFLGTARYVRNVALTSCVSHLTVISVQSSQSISVLPHQGNISAFAH